VDSNGEIFLGRQPILDRSQKLVAYELLFRSGQQNSAEVVDNLAATANVISHAFVDIGIESVLGPCLGFINCDEALLLSDMPEILPPQKIVLEVLETVEVTPEIVERCADLRQKGFTLALDDFVDYADKFRPLLDLVEIVKVDLQPLSDDGLRETTGKLKQWPLRLLAEKVDSREQADFCLGLGYSLFQGYYFARPTVVARRRLEHSQLALMRLLNLIVEDAETRDLEGVFKQEPGLTVNLMRITNSVATGVQTRITSLRHAITVLGRRPLQRWLQLLLYSGGNAGLASPLLHMAATRGRLMELLAAKIEGHRADLEERAFMTGIMSLMPALMGMPLEEILKGLKLDGDVQSALESGGGTLGHLLCLAQSLETGDGAECHERLSALPGLDHRTVNASLAEALAWAASIGQERHAGATGGPT